MNKQGLFASDNDPCLFIKEGVIVLVYVDNTLCFSKNAENIPKLLKGLRDDGFELTDEGKIQDFLGIRFDGSKPKQFTLTQTGLIEKVLRTTGVQDCNGSKESAPASQTPLGSDKDGLPFDEKWDYASVIGMLLYLSSNSRPDIAFAVHQCARFTHNPKKSHGQAVKRTLRYLQSTRTKGLIMKPDPKLQLDCYVDADFAGSYGQEDDQDPICVKSRTGYVLTLGNCPLMWVSKLQGLVTLSTLEAECGTINCHERFASN